MWDHFPHLLPYLHFLHTCAHVAQRQFAHLSRFSARGRKSSRQRTYVYACYVCMLCVHVCMDVMYVMQRLYQLPNHKQGLQGNRGYEVQVAQLIASVICTIRFGLNRLCTLCPKQVQESEYHTLIQCSAFDHIRPCFPHLFDRVQSLHEFISQPQCALSIATFISKVLEHRESLLTFTRIT